MDYRLFDSVRRQASPVEVELVEAFAQGKISRRAFVARGSMIGLGMPLIGAILAACGSDNNRHQRRLHPFGRHHPYGRHHGPGRHDCRRTRSSRAARCASLRRHQPVRSTRSPWPTSAPTARWSTCFDYLVDALGGDVTPMLAETWKPNADGSVWTFNLRKGVKWHDGTPFTSADVVATMDRLAGSNLKASIAAGSTKAIDDFTVEITLLSPDGQFPQQVGAYNPQSVITPKDFVLGTTLDKRPTGTGAFKLTKYDAATGATFEANPDWWGGKPFLDKLEYSFSDDLATQVSGLQGGAADAITQFSVVGGDALLNDSNITVETIRGAAHRRDLDELPRGRLHRQEGAPGCRARYRPPGLDRHHPQGQGRHRQRPPDRPDLPVLRLHPAAARARRGQGQAAAQRCGQGRPRGDDVLPEAARDPTARPDPAEPAERHRDERHALSRRLSSTARSGARSTTRRRSRPAATAARTSASSTTASAASPTSIWSRRMPPASGTRRTTSPSRSELR